MEREGNLRQLLGQYFSREELRSICFDLGIDHENFPEGKEGLCRGLILYAERKGRLDDLLRMCKRERPSVLWPDAAAPLFAALPYEPETVAVPAGPFLMGPPPGLAASAGESPQHEVELPAYHIGKYPVTNAQYAEFIKQNPEQDRPESAGWSGRRPPVRKKRHPVVKVSWYDALAYCRWLSRVTGRPYRLAPASSGSKPSGHSVSASAIARLRLASVRLAPCNLVPLRLASTRSASQHLARQVPSGPASSHARPATGPKAGG